MKDWNWTRVRPWAQIIASALLLGVAAIATLGWLDTRHAADAGWLYNANGYQQAAYRATQSGKPLLLWLQQGQCRRCEQLEQRWRDNNWQELTRDWLRVRIDGDADVATAQLLAHYRQQAALPVWILEHTPQGEFTPIYFNASLTEFRIGSSGAPQRLTAETLKEALDSWLLDTSDETASSPASLPVAASALESETE